MPRCPLFIVTSLHHAVVCIAVVWLAACGTGSVTGRSATDRSAAESPGSGTGDTETPSDEPEVTDPAERAQAGGWTGAPLEPPPHYCNDEGGQEWCDGARDDDCDGLIDEGCADCVNDTCVRFPIAEERMRTGAGRSGQGECVGPVYCGRIDGYATTSPPGGCGHHHCATVIWSDRTARPTHCTIYGRCVDGEFTAKSFSW
ncbi:MAG: hypothetical protein JRH11_23560 [Deltaproteobacteria bacterium]|nr:hypothetical protein [Deltaproteobacteria bacterium]